VECKILVLSSTEFRFLLAKLQMEHILSPRTTLAQMKRFETVPKDLYPAYNSVIERIKNGREGDADFAVRIISWIYRARRILKMDELLEALVVEEYSQEANGDYLDEELDAILEDKLTPTDIVETCKGFILHEESSGSVRFIHETAKGFIQSELEHKLQLPSPIRLAKTCLIYFGSNAFDTPCTNRETLEVRVRTYKFGRYAAQYLADHIKGDTKGEEEMQRAICSTFQFLGKRESMDQMKVYAESPWGEFRWATGRSFLHFSTANGFATICKRLLVGTSNDNDRYVQRFV
jgi:hypothetical protein